MKVYGPYTRKDGRQHVVLYENGKTTTKSYPKYLMEQKLNRELSLIEHVDHIDNDPTNNTEDNFQVIPQRDNIRKSHPGKGPRVNFVCDQCNNLFEITPSALAHKKKYNSSGKMYCSQECQWNSMKII